MDTSLFSQSPRVLSHQDRSAATWCVHPLRLQLVLPKNSEAPFGLVVHLCTRTGIDTGAPGGFLKSCHSHLASKCVDLRCGQLAVGRAFNIEF